MKKVVCTIAILFFTTCLSAEEWQVVDQMPLPVASGQAVVHDSLIYILGGFSDTLASVSNFIQGYNPKTKQWSFFGKMVSNRENFVISPYGDSLIIVGGFSENFPADPSGLFGIELWDYKNLPGHINRINSNFARNSACGTIYENILYLFGGLPSPLVVDSLSFPHIFGYDIPNGTEFFREDSLFLGEFVYDQMLARKDNQVFLYGGVSFSPANFIYRFDLKTHEFVNLPNELLERRAGGRAVFHDKDYVYIIGGYNGNNVALASTEIFQFHNNDDYSITNGPPLISARSHPMAVEYDGSIYVFGGFGQFGQVIFDVEKLDLITSVDDRGRENILPVFFALKQNYPNPFNPKTTIKFVLRQRQETTLTIYNLSGQLIKTLVHSVLLPGEHRFLWDSRDENNTVVPSGVYVYQLSIDDFKESKKMLLLK